MPVSDSPSDLVKSWGECDGHVHGSSAGAVCLGYGVSYYIITDVGTCVTHRSCHVTDLYIVHLAGKLVLSAVRRSRMLSLY